MAETPDLFTPRQAPAAPVQVPAGSTEDAEILRRHLQFYKCWRTRSQICEALNWSERQVRQAAETLGPDIVRCQAGFKLTADLVKDDLPVSTAATEAFLSQGKRMIRYGLALKRRLHSLIR